MNWETGWDAALSRGALRLYPQRLATGSGLSPPPSEKPARRD